MNNCQGWIPVFMPADDTPSASERGHVNLVGQYGAHATAKRAGFRKGDVIISFDGQNGRMTESALLAYGGKLTVPGQRVAVKVLRQGRSVDLTLPIQ